MKEYLNKLSVGLKKVVCLAAKVSQQTRMPAYLVGGCIRDLILGVENLDLDIAVEGKGIIFAQNLAKRLNASLKTHERFGTATLILTNGLKVDIATARQETYPYPAALPVVDFGTLSEDLKRRDFTINAMAISLDKQQGIIDLFGGQDDLGRGKIRILHNLSFKDDPTRIFRAVRFSQRFDFKIEPKTLALLKEAINNGLLDKVNPHRLRDELRLILKELRPFGPLKQLHDLGALSFISNKLKIGKSTQNLFRSIDKQVAWFIKSFPARRPLDVWLVYFMAFLEPFTLLESKIIINRLGLPKGDQKRIISYFQMRKKLVTFLSKKKLRPEQIFLSLEPLSYETIILFSAICKNKNLKKCLVDFFKFYNGTRLCVRGSDLGRLGVLPGPEYQEIFAKVLAAKLNGKVKNRQTELALIKGLVKEKRSV